MSDTHLLLNDESRNSLEIILLRFHTGLNIGDIRYSILQSKLLGTIPCPPGLTPLHGCQISISRYIAFSILIRTIRYHFDIETIYCDIRYIDPSLGLLLILYSLIMRRSAVTSRPILFFGLVLDFTLKVGWVFVTNPFGCADLNMFTYA